MKLINYKQNKNVIRKLVFSSLMVLGIAITLPAQEVQRTRPTFWWGISGAANVNMYTGTTQRLTPSLMAPAALHEGFGIRGFGSVLLEYRPISFLGFMLNLGYDNRGGEFDQVLSPCNCPEDLKTNLSYATIQPSIRISPFGPDFYVFLGGAYGYNIDKSFTYSFDQNTGSQFTTHEGEFSDIRRDVFSTHVGIGYDIQLADAGSRRQIALSPFVSYHPYFGQAPRDIESWSLSTVRVGMALKFGKGKVVKQVNSAYIVPVAPIIQPVAVTPIKADFIIKAPEVVAANRTINEAFPLRNYIFFEEKSSDIPNRYVKLTPAQAGKFNPEQLQKSDATDQTGRSKRQMNAYYNILNILGYRMNEKPSETITLIGASAGNGEALGLTYAESVKRYLVNSFGISSSRIKTEGRNQPKDPSASPGDKKFLPLLLEGDRRVDIVSSPSFMLKPLQLEVDQIDPLDSRVLFTVDSEESQPFKSWKVDVTDESGMTTHYGPYTRNQESISGNSILGKKAKGNYKFVLTGETTDGAVVRKERSINLVRSEVPNEDSLRFSILFDFDKANAVADYENFLTKEVAPHIVSNGTVIIHGHTDLIGSQEYNMKLSERRAIDSKQILEKAVAAAGKTGVKYEVYAFGMDADNAPFDNKLPEERFYNRTVIIDIIQPR